MTSKITPKFIKNHVKNVSENKPCFFIDFLWFLGDSRRDAQPAAPDGSEKHPSECKNLMLSAAINPYRSFNDCSPKPCSTHSKIWPKISSKSTKNRAQASQNPPRFDLAAPNPWQIDARASQSGFFSDFRRYLEGQNWEKIIKIA